jgi:uncharacterized membrane protein
MRIELKRGNWDIIAIFILTFIFTLSIIFLPDLVLIRIILGIPYLLFFPGYVLTVLLFPGIHIEEEEEESERKEGDKDRRRINFNPLRRKQIDNEIEEPADQWKPRQSLDLPVRIGLSVVLSLAMIPIIGLILNNLYLVNESIFGLRLAPIILTFYSVTMIIGVFAILRRNRLPKDMRYSPVLTIGPFSDGSLADRIITFSLVALVVLATAAGVYLYRYHYDNQKYTEFFLLGPDRRIADFPEVFHENEEMSLHIGIRNNEFETKNYTLMIYLDSPNNEPEEISYLKDLEITQSSTYVMFIEVDHSEEYLPECTFRIPNAGLYILNFVLYLDEAPYRTLRLRTQVFEEEDLLYYRNASIKFFISGPGGIPSDLPDVIDKDERLSVELGIIVDINTTTIHNMTIYTEHPETWVRVNSTTLSTNVTNVTGSFIQVEAVEGNWIVVPLSIRIQEGTWDLSFSLNRGRWNLTVRHNIRIR